MALAFLGPGSHRSYADTSIDSEEQAFIDLINQYRADNNLGPLLIDPSLQNASEWMSTDLGEKAYFSHTDSKGRDPWDRMCDFGYCYNTWKGENIAAGYSTGQSVFQGWHDSPGHNANMLGSHYTVMGLARVYVQGSPYGYYWTNDFGGYTAPGSSPPPGPTMTPTATPHAGTPTPTRTPTPTPNLTATPTPTPTLTPSFADIDCDQQLTGRDSVLILEFAAGISYDPGAGCPRVGSSGIQAAGGPRYHGDLDCNGIVDARDALVVLHAMSDDVPLSDCT
jgi:hypothetical protein